MGMKEVFPILSESEAADLTTAALTADLTIIKVFAMQKGLPMMNDSQRALLSAMILQHNTLTQQEVGDALDVARTTIQGAAALLRNGSELEIAQVGAGARGIHKLARIVNGKRPDGHARRAQRARENSELWQHLRSGIEHIGSLPLPAEMVRIARNNKQTIRFIDERMQRTIKWLEDFSDAWSRSNDPQT